MFLRYALRNRKCYFLVDKSVENGEVNSGFFFQRGEIELGVWCFYEAEKGLTTLIYDCVFHNKGHCTLAEDTKITLCYLEKFLFL